MTALTDPNPPHERERKVRVIFAVVLFGLFMAYFFVPITDIDSPWHLKTGQYILEKREVPFKDPFLHTSEGLNSPREKFLMTQYWLAQTVFAVIHKAAGFIGLAAFNAAVFSALCLIVWRVFSRKGLFAASLAALLLAPLLKESTGFRPQMFSFLFTLLTVLILDGYLEDDKKKRYIFFLPLIMLAWANMHGGFVYGDLIILLFAGTEMVNAVKRTAGPAQKIRYRLFGLICLVSVLASFVNPNGFGAIEVIMNPDSYVSYSGRKVLDYYSLMELFYVNPSVKTVHFLFWIFLAYVLVIVGLSLARRTVRLRDVLLTACSLYMAVTAVRYMSLFLLTMLPLVAKYDFRMDISPRALRPLRLVQGIITALLLFSLAYSVSARNVTRDYSFDADALNPVRAVKFIRENRISGKFFNSHYYGGYLTYHLYPLKFFSDSRSLYPGVSADGFAIEDALRLQDDKLNLLYALLDSSFYRFPRLKMRIGDQTVTSDTQREKPEYWEKLLDQYGIDIIIHKACDPLNGGVYPIVLRLVRNDDWALIYSDGSILIFVRRSPKFQDLIRTYEKDKGYVFDEIVFESLRLENRSLSSLAFGLTMSGDSKRGLEIAKEALERDKDNLMASFTKAVLTTVQK